MTNDEFYKAVQGAIEEESDAGSLYLKLAKDAPNEHDRECLMKMARQEIMHRANLEWIHMKKDIK